MGLPGDAVGTRARGGYAGGMAESPPLSGPEEPLPAAAAAEPVADAPAVLPRPALSSLFLAFLKLGATAFGGPAMVAYIREVAVTQKCWLSARAFSDGVALCQTIPGATAMQTAAYVGLRARGVPGAFIAFAGFALPAFLLMILFAALYNQGINIQSIASVFHGLQWIVIAIMANATLNFGKTSLKNLRDAGLALCAAGALALGAAPFAIILAAAVVGVPLYWTAEKKTAPAAAGTATGLRRSLLPGLAFAAASALALALLYFFRRPKLFDLGVLMVKIDSLAFGGGFASVPLMLHEVVETKHWLDAKMFMDAIALGQVTPGPIVITATFVGWQLLGWAGAVAATVGIFSPSLLVVLLTVPYLDRLNQSRLFRAALRGPLVSFVALLLVATIRLALTLSWAWTPAVLCVAALAALRLRAGIAWVVLAGAALSALIL